MQHLERKIIPADTTTSEEPGKDAQTIHLIEYLKAQPVVGTYELKVAETKKRKARIANVNVRVANVWVPRPSNMSPWLRAHGPS